VSQFISQHYPNERIDAAVKLVREGISSAFHRKPPSVAPAPAAAGGRWFPSIEVLCPYASFGRVQTAHRDEIEGYMALYNLFLQYLRNPKMTGPISVATFGQPGAGKSLAIKEIVSTISPEAAKFPLEFNVAQFSTIQDLCAALHKVHDQALVVGTPLVIFDEFDCSFEHKPLGWLKYFLAPMSDGVFRDGGAVYKVGRAIFLFAGGTSNTFGDFFETRASTPETRDAKLPDFVSRLRGHLNILGINPQGTVDDDLLFRRAIVLRTLIELHAPWLINPATSEAEIEHDVVRALLTTSSYKHGVRSMQAIIEMATTSKSKRFNKSSLPTAKQLQMHVDANDFHAQMASL
jgi:hypothetical protein